MINLVYADEQGKVFDDPQCVALGRSGDMIVEILDDELIPLPEGASLVSLPGTRAVYANPSTGDMQLLPQPFTAVGALLPQGYTRLLLPAYVKSDQLCSLPLFGYTAVVWKNNGFHVAAVQSDDPSKWDPSQFNRRKLLQEVDRLLQLYPGNRLYSHLAHCALEYDCLTASNTFLRRWEGGAPVSASCNAACFGCISEQAEGSAFIAPQTRMNFKPRVEELTELMLHHLVSSDSIISLGQGCEGEPTTQASIIIEAISQVRSQTRAGYINMNTNAGLTDQVRGIVEAGLDLIRVSVISALQDHYNAYYQPRGYGLSNVEASLRYARDKGVITSINYLVFPGVSDSEEEIEAMIELARRTDLNLIQLRNLNIDPESYLNLIPSRRGDVVGMKQMIEIFQNELPDTAIGSYTHTPAGVKAKTNRV